MKPALLRFVSLALLAAACGPGAGSSGAGGTSGSGGTSASGGATAGTGGTGGTTGHGGTTGTGGVVGPGGSTGGGGTTGAGGTTGTGGTTGAAGSSGSGGASGTGGASGPAGATGSGGATGRGGSSGRGGASGPAGATGSGGSAGRGGAGSGGSATAGTGGTGTGGTGGTMSGMPGRSAGCGKTSTLTFGMVPNETAGAPAGSGNGVGHGDGGYVKITSANQSRGFALRLPDNYDSNKPYWLIFGFHWNGGNSAQVDNGGNNGYWWAYYGLQRKSNNGAIFVAPDGLNAGWANSGGRDLTFVDDMVKLIEDNYCVDTTHVITSGFSYGGGMSYEIACARAKVFRAAVIYEGAQLSGCDGGNDPIALWQTVGLTDTTCPVSSATPIRDRFVKNNGCTVPAQEPPRPPQPPPYVSAGHVCTNYAGCSSGHPLRWCVHQSGHGPGPVDGNSDLYNSCATAPKTCSSTCPCTWTPDDVWTWLTSF